MMTALDLQEIGLRYLGGNVNDAAVRDVKLAARQAIQELAKEWQWPCYITYRKIALQAPQTIGTITYNATTRQFTLTGGTWPTWAVYGSIRVSNTVARVITRNSATVITIESDTEFTANLASGTTYTLYQDEYPLDAPFHKMTRVFVDRTRYGMEYKDPLNFTKYKRPYLFSSTTPRYYTVYRDRNNPSGIVLAIYPMALHAMTATFSAQRFPADIAVWDEHTGKVAVTATSTAVVGTGTAFDTLAHPGCVLRVSRNVAVPTSLDGDNPYAEEVLIDSVASTTSLAAKTALVTTRTNQGVAISSLVDVGERTMQAVLVQRLFVELSRLRTIKDANVNTIFGAYQKLLSDAKSASRPDLSISHAGDFFRLGGYASTEYFTITA